MTLWLIGAGLVGMLLLVRRARRTDAPDRLPASLRARWGRPRQDTDAVDDAVAEAWRNAPSTFALDARTWEDLDVTRVLVAIDHTETLLGSQILYARVRNGIPWTDSPVLGPVAERCTADESAQLRLGGVLASAGRGLGRGLWRITETDAIQLRWWYAAFPLLTLGMIVAIGWTLLIDPKAALVVALLAVLSMAGRAAVTWQVPSLLVPLRQLGLLLRVADELLALDVLPDSRARHLRSQLAPLRSLRTISGFVTPTTTGGGGLGEVVASAWEYLNLFLLLDANALLVTGRRLQRHANALIEVATTVGEVDMARAIASLRAEPRAWTRPAFTDAAEPVAFGVWHPLVPDPVVNDVPLTPRGGLVITGANMSGKSTYLRSAGIASVLAVTIDSCPASAWRAPARRVRSLIGRADDLASGRSYYLVEAEGVVALLQDAMASPPTLYLLDELLRGTNTVERIAAGEAVVRGLLAPERTTVAHTVFVATHDGELGALLRDVLVPCHFRETVDASGLRFDYQRQDGPARTRTAIALLTACGAPSAVVQAAEERAAALDSQRRLDADTILTS